jgi:site-specific DNA recombinase
MKLANPHVRPALYARVSSDQQAEEGTIASQVADLEDRIGRDGLALEAELRFLDEGYSGSTLVRPALERLRDLAAAGAIDRLYVHSPDRLARKYAYQVLLVDELHRCGVELIFLNRAFGQTPEDDLLLQVQGMVAEYERAKILERSRRGKRHAASRGSINVLSGAPYGYRYIGKREGAGQARYEIVLEEARVVRQIFTWVGQERCSLGEVCRRLRAQGVPSPQGKPYWDRTTVWGILKNPAYRGAAAFGKTQIGELRKRLRSQRGRPEQPRRAYSVYDTPERAIAIAVPALVSEELFAAVAEQLDENRRRQRQGRRGARYLLQGLLACQCCGYAYYGKQVSPRAAKGKKRRYAYYRCTGTDAYRFGGQRVCHNKQVRTDLLEEAVWADVCALLKDPGRVEAEYERRLNGKDSGKESKGGRQLEVLIQKVKRGIARLIDAYGEGLVDKEEFEPRVRAFRERLARLEAEARQQQELEAQERELRLVVGRLQEFAERVKAGLEEADWSTRREIIRALVKRVEIGAEEVRVVYRVNLAPFADSPEGGILPDCRRGDLTALGQRVPALRAGRVVREGGEAAPQGSCLPGALCGRLRHGLCLRGRRPPRAGRAAAAVRQVRSDDPPGQDPSGAVRAPGGSARTGGLWGRASFGVI